ncbi:MAG: Asp-tRNA(Asn)/Glu-tRNA(Gln) amidotransferase subunit GatA [Planctomycetes bacterium]|nr:Asp-tRNA(Asn)/Glu-tRNA(Gln) amidotransferase subunit GatA [Planctomycetota bacterium]
MSGFADYAKLDATALRDAVVSKRTTAAAVVEAALARIAALDPRLCAFSSVLAESARERAKELDFALARGEPAGALCGVPFALKSNMCLEGVEAHCGSKILAGYRPPYTAPFVQRLLDEGAIVVGTTHMDEFAMGSSGENSAYAVAKNPWDPARTPGGSSSGSCAAVAARMVTFSLGSDTGGSVRQPAALCGIVGFKPTYGRVTRYGLVAFGSSLDQVSPFTRSCRDMELVMSVISGADEHDSTCLPHPPIDPDRSDSVRGLRLGVPKEYFAGGLDADVRARVEAAIQQLVALGATTVPIELPHTEYAIPTYYVVATAEASSNLARYDGIRYGVRKPGDGSLQGMIAATREAGFGPEVKRRILLGTYVLSSGYYDAWYVRALKVRRLIRNDFDAAFERVDLIVCPTSPTAAFELGEKSDDPVAMYLSDVMTVPTSLAGLPAVSVPCGKVSQGGKALPVGLQIIGPSLADARVLRAARVFETATKHQSELYALDLSALEGAAR